MAQIFLPPGTQYYRDKEEWDKYEKDFGRWQWRIYKIFFLSFFPSVSFLVLFFEANYVSTQNLFNSLLFSFFVASIFIAISAMFFIKKPKHPATYVESDGRVAVLSE